MERDTRVWKAAKFYTASLFRSLALTGVSNEEIERILIMSEQSARRLYTEDEAQLRYMESVMEQYFARYPEQRALVDEIKPDGQLHLS